MTKVELAALALEELRRHVGRIDFTRCGPAEAALGVTFAEIICNALFPVILKQGSIEVDGVLVGLALPGGIYGLRATDMPAFRALLAAVAEELPDFREEIDARWRALKIKRGELRQKVATTTDRLLEQTFQGFD